MYGDISLVLGIVALELFYIIRILHKIYNKM